MITFDYTKQDSKIKPYIDLSRILKPTGYLLLWIPCLWGLALKGFSILEAFLYLMGAISLRTFGCVINDILDRDFDRSVERTKTRPLACGALTIRQALAFAALSLIPGLFLFLLLPFTNKVLASIALMGGMLYPLAKRFTYWPQLVLGFLFNSGVLITGYNFEIGVTLPLLTLYGAGIFWTLAYDTIYAFQDIKDDLSIGVKSTAIRFQHSPKLAVALFYSAMVFLLGLTGYLQSASAFFYVGSGLLVLELMRTLYSWDPQNESSCLRGFKYNCWIGFWVFILLIVG